MIATLARKARSAGHRVLCHLTATRRTLPDFLIIGAQKAGTTSLYDYIARHPDVGRARRKEVHFFDNAFHRGELWYRSFFALERERGSHRSATGRNLLNGEATPYYLFHPLAPVRAASIVPDARLIIVLRDPVARAYSHYMHEKIRGNEPLSFEDALNAEARRLDGEEALMLRDARYRSPAHQTFSYFARGLYAVQLQRWLRSYPARQMLWLAAERLYSEPRIVMQEVFAFLGLPDHHVTTFEIRNPGKYTGGLLPATEARLRHAYREPNRALTDLIGIDFGWDNTANNVAVSRQLQGGPA